MQNNWYFFGTGSRKKKQQFYFRYLFLQLTEQLLCVLEVKNPIKLASMWKFEKAQFFHRYCTLLGANKNALFGTFLICDAWLPGRGTAVLCGTRWTSERPGSQTGSSPPPRPGPGRPAAAAPPPQVGPHLRPAGPITGHQLLELVNSRCAISIHVCGTGIKSFTNIHILSYPHVDPFSYIVTV